LLEGFNENWFDLGNQNSVTFTNLDPGHYTLKIKAANEENNWGPVEELKIHVSPPLSQTWYAYTFYVIVLISIYIFIRQFYKNREKLEIRLKDEHMNFEKIKAKAKHESEFSQMRLKFFTNISHEFRTPLTLILGPLENFVKNNKWPSEDHLKLMHKNAERLQRLITQILDFRSMESKNLKFEPSWGNITRFVQETAQLFVPITQQKGLEFHLHNNTKDVFAWFDHDKLEKIIYNLLSNAHKHTQKGSITFTMNMFKRDELPYKSKKWKSDEYSSFLELIVHDSGEGIPENKIPHIFDRFYHLQSNNTSVQGTGIGLTLTKELLEIHNGKIFVKSVVEEGSEFRVILPLKTENSQADSTIQEMDEEDDYLLSVVENEFPDKKPQQNLPVILVVEDNEDLRKYMQVEFGQKYKLIEADNGIAGLELALETIPDLIISDLMMPQMDGIELCKEIKKDPRTSHVPIIILTAHSSQFNKIRGYEIGADDYITKPFSSELLVLRIDNLLKGRKELQLKFSREVRLKPKDLQISNMDERFLTKAMEVVEENLNDSEFNADSFASEMCMSRVHLYRKLKALTDMSVSDFVKTARLKLAANLIGENKLTIKEAAYTVGFKDPKYFSKCFKQQFGVKPSEYVINDETATE
jgi:signal transduction histidine kinase/DNA-binding response OmpR family regulator